MPSRHEHYVNAEALVARAETELGTLFDVLLNKTVEAVAATGENLDRTVGPMERQSIREILEESVPEMIRAGIQPVTALTALAQVHATLATCPEGVA